MREIFKSEIIPNAHQKQTADGTPVVVQATSVENLPKALTSLGKKKIKYLVSGIAQVKRSDRVLELFGGTNASTAAIRETASPAFLVSVDLHNSISSRAPWSYDAKENYRRQNTQQRGKMPHFITADAEQLPFADESFDVIIAPDSPRTSTGRLGEELDAGKESNLTIEDQQLLFKRTSNEAFRVLEFGGKYAGTIPLSWAESLESAGFQNIQLFSHAELPGVTKVSLGRELQFKTNEVSDPVVYFKCLKN